MKRGSRNLLDAMTKRNQEETLDTKGATFQPNSKTHSVAEPILPRTDEPIFTPISANCIQSMALNVIFPDPCPETMMKILHHSFRTWI